MARSISYHSLCPFINDFNKTVFEWRYEFIMSHRVRVLNCLDTFGNSINDVESLPTAVSSPSDEEISEHTCWIFSGISGADSVFSTKMKTESNATTSSAV